MQAAQHDGGSSAEGSVPESKKRVAKTLRACDNCRKQKMRCIGSNDPPCKRCRNANLECIFSRQPREPPAPPAGEERIRGMEDKIESMGSMLKELVHVLRSGAALLPPAGSSLLSDNAEAGPSSKPSAPTSRVLPGIDSLGALGASPALLQHLSGSGAQPFGPPTPHSASSSTAHALLGLDSFRAPNGFPITSPSTSIWDPPSSSRTDRQEPPGPPSDPAVDGAGSSEASADDAEEDAPLDIQSSSLLAPLDSMHSLAMAAASAAAQASAGTAGGSAADGAEVGVNGKRRASASGSGVPSAQKRSRVSIVDPNGSGERALARVAAHGKVKAKEKQAVSCIQAGIVTEDEARSLHRTFWAGADKFVAVFDETQDTFELHRDEMPFCLNAVCYVGCFIEDGGSGVSDRQRRLWELVKQQAMETLFSKTFQVHTVQALMLVAAWNEEGFLAGGHAVRLALDIGCHEAFSILLRTGMGRGKSVAQLEDERSIVVKARTWFYLFNFEHQMAFGKGRPTIISVDEGIRRCREFLQHPLAILTDLKLVSTTEIMTIRARYIKQLMPHDEEAIDDTTIASIRSAHEDSEEWFRTWEGIYSRQQTSDKQQFYIESARVTKEYTQLFHNCVALRGIQTPADVARIPPAQRELALRAIKNAQTAVRICLSSPSYRSSIRYGVHHTFVTAAFAASLLIRMARLFPGVLDLKQTAKDVDSLAQLLNTVPAGRYARSLRLTLRSARKQDVLPQPTAPSSPTAHDKALHAPGPPPAALSSGDRGAAAAAGKHGPGPCASPSAPADFMFSPFGDNFDTESTGSGGDWGFNPSLLESFGLALDSDGQLPLWATAGNPGSSQLWTHGMEDFFLPSDIDSQLSFMHAPVAPPAGPARASTTAAPAIFAGPSPSAGSSSGGPTAMNGGGVLPAWAWPAS